MSGSYIGMRPSAEPGVAKRDFIGKTDPPVLQAWTKGTTFMLDSKRLGSISLGSPIFFRDLEVGTVLGWDIGDLASRVTIHAFRARTLRSVRARDSSFWNASGVSIRWDPTACSSAWNRCGVSVGRHRLRNPTDTKQPVAANNQTFPLYRNFEDARAAGFGRQIRLLSYFPGSVAGLEPGAHVTLHGLRIGEVTDVDLVFDPQARSRRRAGPLPRRSRPHRQHRVGRADQSGKARRGDDQARHARHPAVDQHHHRLEGDRLEHIDDAPPATLEKQGDVYIIPTSEVGGFDAITRSAAELLTKLNRIEYDKIGRSIENAAGGLDTTINGAQTKRTLAALEKAMIDVQDIAKKLDTEGTPALKRLPAIAQQLQESLTSANRLFGSFNTGYGDDSRFRRDLDRLIPQLTDAARSIRALERSLVTPSRGPDQGSHQHGQGMKNLSLGRRRFALAAAARLPRPAARLARTNYYTIVSRTGPDPACAGRRSCC
jgi:paraquat-inducible protein B